MATLSDVNVWQIGRECKTVLGLPLRYYVD